MKRALIFFVALVVVAGAIVGVVIAKARTDKLTLPSREVDTFLHAWTRNDPATMATLLDRPPADLAVAASNLLKAVPGSSATYTRTTIGGTKDAATAAYSARVNLKGLGPVEWNGTLALVHTKETGWLITWKPSSLYPGLKAGAYLTVKRSWPARASILAADGSVLAGNQAVVTIGIEAQRIKTPADLQAVKLGVKKYLDVDPASIDDLIRRNKAHPDYFLPVAPPVARDAKYQAIRNALYPIPGIIFQSGKGVSALDPALTGMLGTVGPVTAEQLAKLGAPYTSEANVGQSGVQSAFEKQLAGTPRADVVMVDANRTTLRTIKRVAGKAARAVRLTIDPATQKAAENALAGETRNAALVALDTTTGAIKAVVSKPYGGFDRALVGTYPPGSTFKVVTSAALLAGGSNGGTPAPCPATLTVDGRKFLNFEGEASLTLDLAEAFAQSCNNAFIGLADKLPADALGKAASAFGFNAKWSLGIDTAGGSFPKPSDDAERAASAIGQGRVLASPLQMASVAAAVAAGGWRAPVLVTQPARAKGPVVPALTPVVVSTLRSFMASVVRTGGTAAGAGLPADSFGKTGTAEFGNDNPPKTHAWFVGYRGNVAYAVIVEDGGVGGRVAAPLAAKFVNSAPQ